MRIRLSAVRAFVGASLLTGLSACIFTSPSIPSHLARTSVALDSVAANTTVAPLTVVVRDQDGNPKENVTVVWSIKTGGGTLSATTTETDGDGETSVTYTAPAAAGTNVVLATQPTLAASVGFTIVVR